MAQNEDVKINHVLWWTVSMNGVIIIPKNTVTPPPRIWLLANFQKSLAKSLFGGVSVQFEDTRRKTCFPHSSVMFLLFFFSPAAPHLCQKNP